MLNGIKDLNQNLMFLFRINRMFEQGQQEYLIILFLKMFFVSIVLSAYFWEIFSFQYKVA